MPTRSEIESAARDVLARDSENVAMLSDKIDLCARVALEVMEGPTRLEWCQECRTDWRAWRSYCSQLGHTKVEMIVRPGRA